MWHASTWTIHLWRADQLRLQQCYATHSHVTCFVHMCRDSLTCAMREQSDDELWLQHCYVTHSHGTCLVHTWHDSFTCAMSEHPDDELVVSKRGMPHMGHASFTHYRLRIDIHMRHASLTHWHAQWDARRQILLAWRLRMSHVTCVWVMSHTNESRHT